MRRTRLLGYALAVVLAVFPLRPGESAAAHLKVLHTFMDRRDGALPLFGLAVGPHGNLYGVTEGESGGAGKQCSKGCGDAYALVQKSREHVIFYFDSKHGAVPSSPLLLIDHDLYGTTGKITGNGQGGTVYKLTPGGRQTVLYTFCSETNCADGSYPDGDLIVDSGGNLYGTTIEGGKIETECGTFGNIGCGTLFRLAPDGTETVLYAFCSQKNCADGYLPADGVIADSGGNLYGTTEFGGANGQGTLFEYASGGTYSVLYSFCGQPRCADGAQPAAGLVEDSAGNLFGTTRVGGGGPCKGTPPGCGAVFELKAGGAETVVYAFKGGKADGKYPVTKLAADGQGDLFGTTAAGTAHGGGSAFEILPDGQETILHAFCSEAHCADGEIPNELVVRGKSLFGTATLGGSRSCDCGTVFELTTNWVQRRGAVGLRYQTSPPTLSLERRAAHAFGPKSAGR